MNVDTPAFMRAPARRPACSRWSRRWTSWPPRWAWTRSSCACATTPTHDPQYKPALLEQAAEGVLPAGRRAVRLVGARPSRARCATAAAGGLGHGDGDLPPPTARPASARAVPHRRRPRRGASATHDIGAGDLHGHDPDRRRRPGPAGASASPSSWATRPSAGPATGRLDDDGERRPRRPAAAEAVRRKLVALAVARRRVTAARGRPGSGRRRGRQTVAEGRPDEE